MYSRRQGLFVIMVAIFCLWPWEGGPARGQTSTGPPEMTARRRCSALQGLAIPSSSIGLPTNGGVVVSASLVSATDASSQLNRQLAELATKHGFTVTEPAEILGQFAGARMALKGARALGNELFVVQL